MNHEAPNTLAFYDQCPQVRAWNFDQVAVPDFAINCKNYVAAIENSGSKTLPDAEAIEFYALNHLAAIVRKNFTKHEKLAPWAAEVMAQYQRVLREQGQRIMVYMTLITTRESRHVYKSLEYMTMFKEKFGQATHDFAEKINGSGSSGAVDRFYTHTPATTMGNYVDSLCHCFFKGGFQSSYGGKPWGNIAKTLADFIHGHTSMEMLLDTSYTLAHNNGPIFNKGMVYHTYTSELIKILDVQRSGQIPELVMSGYMPMNTAKVRPLVKKVAELFPSEFNEEVDWQQVEDLGSVNKYSAEKKKMKTTPKPKPKMVNGQLVIGAFKVLPGKTVDVIKRSEELTL